MAHLMATAVSAIKYTCFNLPPLHTAQTLLGNFCWRWDLTFESMCVVLNPIQFLTEVDNISIPSSYLLMWKAMFNASLLIIDERLVKTRLLPQNIEDGFPTNHESLVNRTLPRTFGPLPPEPVWSAHSSHIFPRLLALSHHISSSVRFIGSSKINTLFFATALDILRPPALALGFVRMTVCRAGYILLASSIPSPMEGSPWDISLPLLPYERCVSESSGKSLGIRSPMRRRWVNWRKNADPLGVFSKLVQLSVLVDSNVRSRHSGWLSRPEQIEMASCTIYALDANDFRCLHFFTIAIEVPSNSSLSGVIHMC